MSGNDQDQQLFSLTNDEPEVDRGSEDSNGLKPQDAETVPIGDDDAVRERGSGAEVETSPDHKPTSDSGTEPKQPDPAQILPRDAKTTPIEMPDGHALPKESAETSTEQQPADEQDAVGVPREDATTAPEPTPALPAVVEAPPEPDVVLLPYFLTNRYNLLDMLSSGLIKPAGAYPKYYRDLLAIAPGRIPILVAPAGEVLSEAVSQDDETAFPVALELDPSMINLGGAPKDSDDHWSMAAPEGVVPVTAVTAVHFRSEAELGEVRARRFRNLEIPTDKLRVSPQFFGPTRTDAAEIFEWLGNLPAPTKTKDIETLDRLAGSWAMVAAAAPAREAYLDFAAGLLVGFDRAPRAKRDEPAWIAGGRLRTMKRDRRTKTTVNERVFEASVEALLGLNPGERWRPTEVLDEVREAVVPTIKDPEERSELEKALEYVKAVLRNETDIRPFKPDRGHPAVKALLMVLLRSEPDRVLGWLNSDVGPRYPEYVAAAALSGVLTGWSQLPVELRAAHLESVVTTRMAVEANRGVQGAGWSGTTPRGGIVTTVEIGPTGEALFVTTVDDHPVLELSFELSLAELLARLDLRPDSGALVEIAESAGWVDECIQTVVEALPLRQTKRPGETVFDGKPKVQYAVVPERLRELVVEHGLPSMPGRARERVLQDHFRKPPRYM